MAERDLSASILVEQIERNTSKKGYWGGIADCVTLTVDFSGSYQIQTDWFCSDVVRKL